MRLSWVIAAAAILMPGGAALAQNRPPVPLVVMQHMETLDTRCRAAGGRPGDGRYIVAQDFTGDGRLDYLLSEGNYNCTGRPDLFRRNGQARVDIFVVDARNNARRVYSDVLIGYRVLAGRPVKVQIARKGSACGDSATASTQCAAQLTWNGQGFGEGVSVSSADKPAGAAAPAPAASPAVSGPAPAKLGLVTNAQGNFLAQCRRDYVKADASAARWADDQCKSDWQRVVAAGPVAEAMLAVLPAPGERPSLAVVRQRAAGVRWAARAEARQSASGSLSGVAVHTEGNPPTAFGMGWMQVGAEIPYDVANALRARGVTMTEMSCEKIGTGEGNRTYAGTAPGRAPFTLIIDQRTAPTGDATSYYGASGRLDGRHPPPGSTAGCQF